MLSVFLSSPKELMFLETNLILLAEASRIRLVSRNINSFGDDRKTDSIIDYMRHNKADVFVLIDTRTGPEDTTCLQKNGKAHVYSTTSELMPEALQFFSKTA